MKTRAAVVLAAVMRATIAPMPAHLVVPATTLQQPAAQPTFDMRELNEAEDAALPQGEGRDAVAFMCVPCHGVLPAVSQRKTPLAWSVTIELMRTKGAKGTDEQAEDAATYLSKFFPAVDVNTGTSEELVRIAGFTAEEAAAIIAYRDAGNTLASFTDVKKVPGLDPTRLAAVKPRIVYKPK